MKDGVIEYSKDRDRLHMSQPEDTGDKKKYIIIHCNISRAANILC